MNTNEPLYTVRQVVEQNLLGYKASSIRKFIKNGEIRIVDISADNAERRQVRIPASAIAEFVEKRKS